MRGVKVRSLFGQEWNATLRPGATVAELKANLSELDAILDGCVLSYQCRKLKNAAVVDSLGLGGECFLTAIIKRGARDKTVTKPESSPILQGDVAQQVHTQRWRLHVPGQGASHGGCKSGNYSSPVQLQHQRTATSAASALASEPASVPRDHSVHACCQNLQIQTLEPAANTSRCPAALQGQGSAETQLFQALQADLVSASETQQGPVGSKVTQNTTGYPSVSTASLRPRASKTATSSKDQTSGQIILELPATLPLPEELQRLLNIFKCLNGVYGFLLVQNIQCTWKNSHEAVQNLFRSSSPHDKISSQDLKSLQRLAPDVIVLRESTASDSETMKSFTIDLQDTPSMTSQQQQQSGLTPSREAAGPSAQVLSTPDLLCAGSTRSGSGGATGLGIQRFRKATTKAREYRVRQRLVLSLISCMEKKGHSSELHALLAKWKATLMRSGTPKWPSSLPWQGVTAQEAAVAFETQLQVSGSLTTELTSVLSKCLYDQHRSKSNGPKNRICSGTHPLDPVQFLEHLMTLPWYDDQVCHVENIGSRTATFAVTAEPLSQSAEKALQSKNMSRLYCHQAAAIDAVRRGDKAVVICASTASGKSLCYNIPVIEALHEDRTSCALYIFPTKALAQDQMRAAKELLLGAFGSAAPAIEVYDGDTPMERRSDVRDNAQLLITNPDMLHHSILPSHPQFCRILANLRYIVIDEGHYYSGVFGAHTALVLRRLRRLCETEYNSSPQFIVTSATIANPRPHVQELLGVSDVTVIDKDGSPHGPKSFVLWNPPLREDTLRTAEFSTGQIKRLGQELSRTKKRMANQLRGSGSQLGRNAEAGTAEWLAACKIGKRLQKPTKLELEHQSLVTTNSGNAAEDTATAKNTERPTPQELRRKHFLCIQTREAVAGVTPAAAHARNRNSKTSGQRTTASQCQSLIYHGTLAGGVTEAMAAMQERINQCMKANNPSDPSEVKQGAAGTKASEYRRSPMIEMATLLAECVKHELQTIAFCMTRKLCELVVSYTREILSKDHANLIAVYRSGYSAEERRNIERQLHDGTLRAVCATNALELGVDVGDLDATLHLGFAGSVASLWQQAGRAGRRGRHSIAVYVAFDGPLCQFFMTHPQELFGRQLEQTIVDAHNMQLVTPHVVSAAAEKPLCLSSDHLYFGSVLNECASAAVTAGDLAPSAESIGRSLGALFYVGKDNACARINLRAIDPNKISVVNQEGMHIMEEIEENKAFWQVYPGAIYYHQGRSFLCTSLDLTRQVAHVKSVDVKYYTKTSDFVDVHVVGGALAYQSPPHAMAPTARATVSNAIITTHWMSFNRVWQASGKVFDTIPLHLPDMAYDTQAVFVRVPPYARVACQEACLPFRDGVHAACHALLNIIPIYITCSSTDLGTECDNPYDTRYRPERLLIYDRHPGGIGLARQLHPLMGILIERALELIEHCPCVGDHGCPSCVQHTNCDEYNSVLNKQAGRIVLQEVKKHELAVGINASRS